MEQPFLRAGVGIEFESVVVGPGNFQARGEMHDAGGAECAAGVAVGFVFGRVPGVGEAAGFGVDGDEGDVTFGWGDHAPAPFVVDYGDPVAGQVDAGGGFGGGRRTGRWGAGAVLGERGTGNW